MSKIIYSDFFLYLYVHFSQVYWLGDLNYRINKYTNLEVKSFIRNGDYTPLLQKDQLNEQRDLGNTFMVIYLTMQYYCLYL